MIRKSGHRFSEKDHAQLKSSAGGRVAVRKAARQGEPHLRAAGARAEVGLRTTARRAALHVAQAARRYPSGGGFAIRGELKTSAIVGNGDAAAILARRIGK